MSSVSPSARVAVTWIFLSPCQASKSPRLQLTEASWGWVVTVMGAPRTLTVKVLVANVFTFSASLAMSFSS